MEQGYTNEEVLMYRAERALEANKKLDQAVEESNKATKDLISILMVMKK